jgi:hypothetical protein
VGLAHKSANYINKAPGHKDEATKDRITGGVLEVETSSDEVVTFRKIVLVTNTS